MATNLTEGGPLGKNLLVTRWEMYTREMLFIRKIKQPMKILDSIRYQFQDILWYILYEIASVISGPCNNMMTQHQKEEKASFTYCCVKF